MVAVMPPVRSTLTTQDSGQVVVSFLGFSSGSKAELPPPGSRQVAMPMPAILPSRRAASRRVTKASNWARSPALRSTV